MNTDSSRGNSINDGTKLMITVNITEVINNIMSRLRNAVILQFSGLDPISMNFLAKRVELKHSLSIKVDCRFFNTSRTAININKPNDLRAQLNGSRYDINDERLNNAHDDCI